jgi:hypothetical protein
MYITAAAIKRRWTLGFSPLPHDLDQLHTHPEDYDYLAG